MKQYKEASQLFNKLRAILIDVDNLLNAVASPNRPISDKEREDAKHLSKLLENFNRNDIAQYLKKL